MTFAIAGLNPVQGFLCVDFTFQRLQRIKPSKANIDTLYSTALPPTMSLLDKRGEALGQVDHLSSAECEGVAAEGLPWSGRASKESRAEVEPPLPTLALIHTRRP